MSSFVRPIGVHRDINELEFISALLQSHQSVIRSSGTIKAVDIAVYLKSRHGIIVSEEVIDQLLLTDLAGQIQDAPAEEVVAAQTTPKGNLFVEQTPSNEKSGDDDEARHLAMDISQLTAILLIPELIEASKSRDIKVFAPFREVMTASMQEGRITGPILREIFASVNEYSVSEEVITEMLEIASRPEGLIDALISDVTLYKEHENVSKAPQLVEHISDPEKTNLSIASVYTAPFIDFSADTFRRPSFGMQLWTAGIAVYFAYGSTKAHWIVARCDKGSPGCNVASGIATWFSIFLQIVTMGVPYVLLGSLSNANYRKLYRFPALLFGMVTVYFVTVFSYIYRIDAEVLNTSKNKDKYGTDICDDDDTVCIETCTLSPEICHEEYIVEDDFFGSSYILALTLGCTLLLSQLVDVILQLTPRIWLDGNGLFQRLVLPGTIRQERTGHQAASLRMTQFLTNALSIFNDSSLTMVRNADNATKTQVATALERFLLSPVRTENVGGVFWAWKRIWDGTIFTQEGIWLNSRLLACNFSQLMILGLLLFFIRVFYYKQSDFFYSKQDLGYMAYIDNQKEILFGGNFTEGLGEDYVSFFICTQTTLLLETSALDGFNQPVVFIPAMIANFGSYEMAKETLMTCYDSFPSVGAYLDDSYEVLAYEANYIKSLVADLEVTPKQYIAAAWFGLLVGIAAVAYIATVLIPSFVGTVMKYRSGVKPTLTNPEFLRYRYAMDTTTVLLGSAFWGCFFTATGAFFFAVLLIIFIGYLPLIVGSVVGFFLILLIRLSVLSMFRSSFFSAFYRKKPGATNLLFTVLEVWNIALTLGFVFIRAVKLVVVSILYIARIDTPFLAPGVGRFGPVELDSVSTSFEKDILIHEAYRHMLIERFGLLCLIKLFDRDTFASRAGSSWRLLFVLITMPWLQKYRISRNAADIDEMIAKLEEELEEEDGKFDRKEQMLKISELQSQKAVTTA